MKVDEDGTPRSGNPAALTMSADPASSMPTSDSLPLRSASPIRDPDRYEILGEHGRGGLGRVSRAHDKDLGRDIAIKELLSRGHINDLRFAREAMITARLEHPGIVPVYEAGRWPDGTPFYAMKLVAGRPLRALIAERRTIDERIGLLHHVIAVADAIAYAHGRNIIHRDLKPANVIVGDFGETVVIDWGLAKDLSAQVELEGGDARGSSVSLDDQLTSLGSVVGTPAYMPPEQERGEAVDQRADVFAIGAMLWELCSLQKVPPTDIALRHRMLHRAGIDHDLVVIIDKAIDPDPHGRYRDAGALATDLKAFKSGARITARDYSLAATLAHWTRRHRALAFSAVAFISLLIASVAALAILYRSSTQNAAAARHNAATADERLVQSYVEQGRRALLDNQHGEALVYLTEAVRRGGDSPSVRFMLERAAQPIGSEVLRLPSSSGRMWTATFSPDGRRIVTADDQNAQVWDAGSGARLFVLPHAGKVSRALYTPDASKLVTASYDGSLGIWDAGTGALVRKLVGPTGDRPARYYVAAISPDGVFAAAIDAEHEVMRAWEVTTGRLAAEYPISWTGGMSLEFSQDSHWLAACGGDGVHVLATDTWRLATKLPLEQVRAFGFDPTGPRLVTGMRSGDVSLWSIPTGVRVQHLHDTGEPIARVVFSPDGKLVGAATTDGVQLIWRAESGHLKARVHSHGRSVLAIEFDPTSKLFVSGHADGRLVVSDVEAGLPVYVLEGPSKMIVDAHFDPSSRRVIAASVDGTARVWELGSAYRVRSSPELDRACVTDVNLEQDRRFVAVSCKDDRTRVWDTASDRLVAELPAVTRPAGGLSWAFPSISPAGDLVAIARGNTVQVFGLPGGRLVRTVSHAAPITSVKLASDGHALVTGSADGVLQVTRDGHETLTFSMSHDAIDTAELLPDGRLIATDQDARLALFDLDVGRTRAIVPVKLPSRIRALRLSPDAHRLLMIPEPYHLAEPILWDLERGRMIAQLEGHGAQVYSAQFIRDGHEILTAGTDGTARRWDGATGKLRQIYFDAGGVLTDATISPDGSMVVGASMVGELRFWDAATGASLWTQRAHNWMISGIHFEGEALISRGGTGEITRWEIPKSSAVGSSTERFDRLVRCGPLRFDEASGGLVTQAPSCAVAAGSRL